MEDANFENLLIKDSSWTINENHISPLNHINPSLIQEFFELKVTPYSFRNDNLLSPSMEPTLPR